MIQVWVHFCSADFTATKLPTLNHFPIRSYRRLQNISLQSIYLSLLNCKILQIFTLVKIRKIFYQCGGSWLYQERMWNILCYCPRLHLKQLWWLLQNFMGSPNSGLGVRYPWFYGRVRSLSAVTHFLPRMGPRFLSSFSSVCNLFQLFC